MQTKTDDLFFTLDGDYLQVRHKKLGLLFQAYFISPEEAEQFDEGIRTGYYVPAVDTDGAPNVIGHFVKTTDKYSTQENGKEVFCSTEEEAKLLLLAAVVYAAQQLYSLA